MKTNSHSPAKSPARSRPRATSRSRGPACYIDDLPATIAAMYRRCPRRNLEIDAILRAALTAKGGTAMPSAKRAQK